MTPTAPTTAPILVTGGTGTLGRQLVHRLRAAGREVRVLSRGSHVDEVGVSYVQGDLAGGADAQLEAAVAGAPVVVHCASAKKGDEEATRNLVAAASAQPSPPHLVYVSIVGVDGLSLGYFKAKLHSERVVAGSGLPWTILRATQFYDLVLKGARSAPKLPLVPVPAGFLVQPVDAGEVADRLVELALAEPAGRVPDMAGPEVTDAAELIRTYLRASDRPGRVVPVRLPGTGRIRRGGLLGQGAAEGPGGRRTWEEFLAERLDKADVVH